MSKKRIGERLVEANSITPQQLAQALQAQRTTGERLGRLLIKLGFVSEDDMARLLCEDAGVPFLPYLRPETIPPEAVQALPESLARASLAVPLGVDGGRLRVALADPLDVVAVMSLERATGRQLTAVGAPRGAIAQALEVVYGGQSVSTPPPAPVLEPSAAPPITVAPIAPSPADSGDAEVAARAARAAMVAVPAPMDAGDSVSTIVDQILVRGVSMGATDIHIEPTSDSVEVRYRVDGILRRGGTFPKQLQGSLLSRIKVIAGLNIAETRLPQDGRLRIQPEKNRTVDLRISTFPTLHGEDMVLRVLDQSRVALELRAIGFDAEELRLFESVLRQPHGLVLIVGPTGSGKTTTLYSALRVLNNGERSILTLEDPIEYEVRGIRQSQINTRAGLTFASGLRALLRHDPDVILVGEMRDQETVQIGLSAAMTGHMVLSTLHTNTAAGAIPRILDMGAEPFALASSLRLTISQRLIRNLCSACKQEADVPAAVRKRLSLEDVQLYRAKGCAVCHDSGYKGRSGIFEMLPITEEISTMVYERASAEEIQRRSGQRSLFQAGLVKVRAGLTSVEELFRVASM